MRSIVNVLLVEDSEDDALLILRELRRSGFDPIEERVDTRLGLNEALNRKSWDIIICDYVMPHFSALDALRILQEKELDIPFIVVSGRVGEDIAVEAMRMGAQDYLLKSNLTRLAAAVERELGAAEIRHAHRRMLKNIEQMREENTHPEETPRSHDHG